MKVLGRGPQLPVAGDRIVIGPKVGYVLGFDTERHQVLYGLTYADKDNPLPLAFKGYSLMDQERPAIWRQPGDYLTFRLEYGHQGTHVSEVRDKTRALARIHLLRRLGLQVKGPGFGPNVYVAEGKRMVTEASGKSQYDPQLIRVSIK